MADNNSDLYSAAKESLEATQKRALDISERTKAVLVMSDRSGHDRLTEEILSDESLPMKAKMKLFRREDKRFQRKLKANVRLTGKMQAGQTIHTVVITVGVGCIIIGGGVAYILYPEVKPLIEKGIQAFQQVD